MNMSDIIPAILIIAIAGIIASFTSTVLTDFQADQTADGYAYNSTENALKGIDKITSQFSNLGLVLIVAIIVGVLFFAFGGMMKGR